jgi:hypothetical protein
MGQYYKIVNLDKRQYVHPHRLGNGVKLLEFGCSAMGALTAVAILLADGNGRGGGDLYQTGTVKGSAKDIGYQAFPKKVPDDMRVDHEWDHDKGKVVFQSRVPKIIGSWAGDRIVVAGDYADTGKYGFDSDRVIKRVERRLPEGFSGQVKDSDYRDVEMEYVEKDCTLYTLADLEFEDVSLLALAAMLYDSYILESNLEDAWGPEKGYCSNMEELIEAIQMNDYALKYANEWAVKKGVELPEAIRTKGPAGPKTPEIDPAFAN